MKAFPLIRTLIIILAQWLLLISYIKYFNIQTTVDPNQILFGGVQATIIILVWTVIDKYIHIKGVD